MTTSAEIPFRIGSNQKWISGISEDTTCRDILVAVLQSESLLDCGEDVVHHHFALVETWRQVSKVLSPNSLILKIWLAWDEEQPNVMFSVKRIKNDKRSSTTSNTVVQSSLETHGQDARSRKTVKRRNSSKIGTGSKQALDTVHPRALNRSKQMVCKEIQDQMKKIINQGEIIRKHLENMKEFENPDEKLEHPATSKPPLVLDGSRSKMISVQQNLTSQKYSFLDKSDNNSDSAFNESFLDSPSPKNNPARQPNSSENVSFESINLDKPPQKCPKPEASSECDKPINNSVQSTNTGPKYSSPPGQIQESKNSKDNQSNNVEDQGMVFNLLENIHRLNCLLESKEEQVLTLGSTVQMVGEGSQDKAVNSLDIKSCFDQEVAHYRDLNARLLSEIQVNSGHLEDMVRSTNMRRKMVTQLEFDVNIIERESKRLQSDLSTIQSMGTKLHHNYDDKEPRGNQEQSPRSLTSCHQESPRNSDNHPPPSQPSSPKNTEEVTNNSNVSYQQQKQQQTDYNSVKKVLEYGSDSSSDTGVCSLSSTEGDYSLSTLV